MRLVMDRVELAPGEGGTVVTMLRGGGAFPSNGGAVGLETGDPERNGA
jgi:hypothetical protein